jgi:DNA modification methylase
MIPERIAIEMISTGWILRNKIIWRKTNGLPSSAKDRFSTKHEYLYFFTKSQKYFFDLEAVKMPLKQGTIDRMFRGRSDDHKFKRLKMKGREYYQGLHNPQENLKRPARKGKKEIFSNENKITTQSHSKTMENVQKKILNGDLNRNPGDVWEMATSANREAHFATYPEKLCEIPIKSGCPEGGIVLDPFCGAGTTLLVAKELRRKYIGIDLKEDHVNISKKTVSQKSLFI